MEKIAEFLTNASKYTQGFDKEFREGNEGAAEMEGLFHKYDVAVADFVSKTKHGKKYIDKIKQMEIVQMGRDKSLINELERHISNFAEEDDTDWNEIKINNEKWYVKKIDSTHLFFSNDLKREGIAMHVAQFKGRPFYDDLTKWLHGRLRIDGKSYRE